MTTQAVSLLAERETSAVDPIDRILGTDDIYGASGHSSPVSEQMRLAFVARAIEHHRTHNPLFDKYCEKVAFSSQSLGCEADLGSVPLLPTGLFKRPSNIIVTRGSATPVIHTTSSGTHGTISTVPRDDTTIMRFFASVAIGKREVLGVETFDRKVFSLMPPSHEFPNLWIAYVMQGVSVLYTTQSYVRQGVLEVARLVDNLRRLSSGEAVNIVGPPPLLLDLAAYLKDQLPLRLNPESLVITIGGWKRREGEKIPRQQFDQEIAAALGIPQQTNVRDTYNMVELNTVLFECAAKVKHCPPWMVALARDPRTAQAMPSGQPGLLSFLDPTPLSYPGFVLSDDFGCVEKNVSCTCGITGDTVTIDRRVNRVEARGCALKLETLSNDSLRKGAGA